MSKAVTPEAGAGSDTSTERSVLCRDSFERYRHVYNVLTAWIVVQTAKVKTAIDAANNHHPSPPGDANDVSALLKSIRLYYQNPSRQQEASIKRHPAKQAKTKPPYPTRPAQKQLPANNTKAPALTAISTPPIYQQMEDLLNAMDHLDSIRARLEYNYTHNRERAYCPTAIRNLANTRRWIDSVRSETNTSNSANRNETRVRDFYITRNTKRSWESLLNTLKKELPLHGRLAFNTAKAARDNLQNPDLERTLTLTHDLHRLTIRYQHFLASPGHKHPFPNLTSLTQKARELSTKIDFNLGKADTAINKHEDLRAAIQKTYDDLSDTNQPNSQSRKDLNNAEKDLKKHNDRRAELEREHTRLYNLKHLLLALSQANNETSYQQVTLSSALLLSDIQAPQKLDAALLAYDRIRLIQRIYSAAESLIYWPIAAIDLLISAGTFVALTAFCASNAAYGVMETISTIAKSGSLYMSIIGISWMFLDAFTQMCLAFRKRPEETTSEWKVRIKQDWRQLLKAKILERGRWVAFLFSGLVAGLMVTTKDLLSGNYMAIYVVLMLSKLLYVGIACGIVGYKYRRLGKDIKTLQAIHHNTDKSDTEIQTVLKKEKVTPAEIAKLRALLRITDPKTCSSKRRTEKTLPSQPGKINWYFLLPTMWIPLGSLWIARAVNVQKNKHLQPGETKKNTFNFLLTTPEKEETKEPCPLIEELKAQRLKQATTFRQKILCMGFKITLLAVLASTVFDISPEIKASLYIMYGVAHALYKIIRFVGKKTKRAKFKKELSSAGQTMKRNLSYLRLHPTPSPRHATRKSAKLEALPRPDQTDRAATGTH